MKKIVVKSLMMSLALLSLMASCGNQKQEQKAETPQPVEFFRMINVGDNLETCVAKGYVESSNAASLEWQLTDEKILEYFPHTKVKFDANNEIQEIELSASNMHYAQSSSNVDVERSFNYILKYLAQRYTGMQKTEINEEVAHTYDRGTEFKWDTPQLAITVKFFETKHDDEICNNQPQGALVNWCASRDLGCGTFAEVYIVKK